MITTPLLRESVKPLGSACNQFVITVRIIISKAVFVKHKFTAVFV